jgi:uncharacterized protein
VAAATRRYARAVEPRPPRRGIPPGAGLIAVALAVAVALPLSAAIVIGGVKSIKHARNEIVVTGSARYPIRANLASWTLRASALERTPSAAIKELRTKVARIDTFLDRGGVPMSAISKPPIQVTQVFVSVPTGLKKPAFRQVPAWRVSQQFSVETTAIDTLAGAASHVGNLLAAGTDVSVSPISYLSTKLTAAKFAALKLAVADARERATTIAAGLDGHLGAVQKTHLGVYQITPRNSTEVSDYGIDDTTSRLKDVEAVVSVTFLIEH